MNLAIDCSNGNDYMLLAHLRQFARQFGPFLPKFIPISKKYRL